MSSVETGLSRCAPSGPSLRATGSAQRAASDERNGARAVMTGSAKQSRDEVRLQGCNYRLVIVLCERPTSLRPYKSEGRGPQGELCDDFVVGCFNNGHGIILTGHEVKGF